MSEPGAPSSPGSPGVGGALDPARVRGGSGETWRAFATATRLGWQMEANWTDPFLFFVYSVAKPIASVLILVAMLEIIGGSATREYRGYVVVGSALWSFVMAGIAGLAWSILDDRERYRMLKYVVVSPSRLSVVLMGRGVARVAVGAMGAVITLAFGIVLLGVSFDLARVDWPLVALSMLLGLTGIVAVGLILAAVIMQTRQEAWSYPEAVAGALFLVSGAVFPLAVLPDPVELVGLVTPLPWWIEGVRRALLPDSVSGIGGQGSLWTGLTGTPAPEPIQVLIALFVTGVVSTLAAAIIFRAGTRRASSLGLFDRTTGS